MDKKYIEENEIEIKYLRNQLSDKELEEFEVYLMENPERIDDLELMETLILGMNKSRKTKLSTNGFVRNWRKILEHPRVALPMTGLFGLSLGLFSSDLILSSNEQAVAEISSIQYVELVSLRGFADDIAVNTLVLNANNKSQQSSGFMGLLLDTGVIGPREWKIEIEDKKSGSDMVIATTKAISGDDGFVLISLPITLIKKGEYSARVSGKKGAETLLYSFVVVEK